MLSVNRLKKIKEILFEKHSVMVSEMASLFGVSEETIRRDLNKLEDEGLVKKTYGGAILTEEYQNALESILPLEQRKSKFFEEKDAIGRKALEIVGKNKIVVIDAGTTVWCVARYLKKLSDMTFITNGILIAQECSQAEDSSVHLIGGKVFKKSMSLIGPQAIRELKEYNADYAFLGTSGINLENGFTSSDLYEAEVKRNMISVSQKVVVVADHSKFNRKGFLTYANFHDIDILITSDLVDEKMLREIQNRGVEVQVCSVLNNTT